MKFVMLISSILALTQIAHAETVVGEAYSYAFFNGITCDISRISDAAQAAVDAALNDAAKVCTNPEVLAVRILTIEPKACRTWNAGYMAKSEVEFNCDH